MVIGRTGQDSAEVDRRTRRGSEEARNISEETFHQIRELIVHGKLAPGGRIVEADLADRLGVSRTPIRSALHRLQQEGYILVGPGSESKAKLSVAPLTREDSQELYSIVGRLEGLAALATASLEAQARAVVVQKLMDLNEQLRELAMAGHGDPNTIFDLDMGFHQAIIEAGAGTRLRSLHAAIKPQTERYWRLYASSILDQLGLSVGEHVLIIESLSNGSAESAERAVQMNWQNGAERLSRVIATMGERGSW